MVFALPALTKRCGKLSHGSVTFFHLANLHLKNWCCWTVVLEKTLESPLDCKEIKPVNPKGNQPWIFIVRIDAEAEAPIIWPPDVKNWLIGKDPNAGKEWRQEEKGMAENEIVVWHHWLNEYEFEQAPGVWWWTVRPGVLQSMGSQRTEHDWASEVNWTEHLNKKRKCTRLIWELFQSSVPQLSWVSYLGDGLVAMSYPTLVTPWT